MVEFESELELSVGSAAVTMVTAILLGFVSTYPEIVSSAFPVLCLEYFLYAADLLWKCCEYLLVFYDTSCSS